MDIAILASILLPIWLMAAGGYLLYKARRMRPDEQWQQHSERQQALGLQPVRTAHWERDIQIARWHATIAGSVFFGMGVVMAWMFWS